MSEAIGPLYRRTYLLLRERILAGEWGSGALFPTEQELCQGLCVSRVTVRRALEMLAADNMLQRFQGRGSIVTQSVFPRPVRASISGQIDNAEDLGRRTKVKLLHFGAALPPPPVAEAFGAAPGEKLHRNVRLRSRDGAPVSHVTSWLPADVARRISRADLLSSRPILAMLQGMFTLAGADQVISATLADGKVAELLALPPGAPLLEVTRTVNRVMDENDSSAPVMVSLALYNPSLYRYRLRLDDPEADLWEAGFHA